MRRSSIERSPSRIQPTVLVTLFALVVAACGGGATDTAGDSDTGVVEVVATTTILGDVARNVVGDKGKVEVLIPTGADPHDYQASSQQIAAIRTADLVLTNGLNLEEGLGDILDSLEDDGANIFEVTSVVDVLEFGGDGAACDPATDHEEGTCDPHVWHDPVLMADAARAIAAELTRLDGSADWGTRADEYAAELTRADEQIQSILKAIPTDDRKIVTSHLAFGYFAARYDFNVVGVVIPGGSTLAEPSSSDLAALVDKIKSENVKVIFADTTGSSELSVAVAAEVGFDVSVIELYTGSLGEPGSGADTLIGMLITNAESIAAALT